MFPRSDAREVGWLERAAGPPTPSLPPSLRPACIARPARARARGRPFLPPSLLSLRFPTPSQPEINRESTPISQAMKDAVEMAVLSSVTHPNIVSVYSCMTDMVEVEGAVAPLLPAPSPVLLRPRAPRFAVTSLGVAKAPRL
jgi:hypothetical protein